MTPRCDNCDRPATYHAAWRTPTMPVPKVDYACDDHRYPGMVPVDQPITFCANHGPEAFEVEEENE